MAEVAGDGLDTDCDGVDALRRKLMERSFPSGPWTWAGTVTPSGDGVKVGNALLARWGSITRAYTIPVHHGKIHAVLGLSANTSNLPFAECTLRLKTQKLPVSLPAQTVEWTLTGQGTGTVVTPALGVVAAPRSLREVAITCDAGASVTIDWFSLQNTGDVVPPAQEVEVSWADLGLPGGGLTSTVVRAGDSTALWAGSDVGGIARRDLTSAGNPWRMMSGDPALGALVSQPELAVWEILPSSWGEVFILTGRASGTIVRGGLLSSVDDGASWQALSISQPDPDNNDAYETTVAGNGRYTVCPSAPPHEYAGGALLVEEPGTGGVYIANHDAEDIGLAYWDGTEACSLASTDLPGGAIRALARVESDPSGIPGLLVGYRGMGGSVDSLYLCSLPLDTASVVDFDCGDTTGVTCEPVTDGVGIDVRDIEIDALLGNVAYIADGGSDPGSATCQDDPGGLYWLDVTDDGLGNLDYTWLGDVSSGIAGLDAGQHITGVSMDPDGDFLFAFVPVTPGGPYAYDRMYRIAYDDIGGALWEPINEEAADESVRAGYLDLGGAWLDASTAVVARPRVSQQGTAAPYAPGQAMDGVWFTDSAAPPADACGGSDWSMAMTTTVNMWRAEGLDGACDGSAWDPEDNTTWTFWPEAEQPDGQAWQLTVAHDVAYDADGNTWSTMGDLGLAELPYGQENAEVDCLWDAFGGGGSKVSATPDGAVWMTLYDQDYGGNSIPHNIGVFRTLDGGLSWEYEGAAIPDSYDYAYNRDNAVAPFYYDRLSCVDGLDTHVATAFGELAGQDDGNAFLDASAADETDQGAPCWGLPFALDALDADTAVVGFQGYSAAAYALTQTGRIGYTVDGGLAWDSVSFDGDWDLDGADADDCSEAGFFDGINDVALVQDDLRTFNDGGTDWRLEFFTSSFYGSTTSYDYEHCALARVVVEPDADGIPEASWTWYTLDRDDNNTVCRVDGRNLGGVATSPWGEEAFIHGAYGYVPSTGNRFGGVCAVDIDDPGLRSTVASPVDWRFSVGSVAPHPWVADLLAVAPILDASAWAQCQQDGDSACPDAPRVLLGERSGSTWTISQVSTMAPSLAGSALAWTSLDEPGLVYGTAGSGAWLGTLSWD